MATYFRDLIGAGAFAVCFAAMPAGASTLDVFQQFNSPGPGTTVIGKMNHPDALGNQQVQGYSAGAYQMKSRPSGTMDAFTNFIAYCVEITVPLTTKAEPGPAVHYSTTGSLFGAQREQLIATLFAQAYDANASAFDHGAFQLTLWSIIHGDVSSTTGSGFDLTERKFDNFPGGGYLDYVLKPNNTAIDGTFEFHNPGIFARAQGWLDALNQDGGAEDWTLATGPTGLTYLISGDSQDLVTYTPGGGGPGPVVPLPAPALLLGSALLGLVWRGAASRRAARA